MTQGGYQVIIILPIKSKMAAAKKQRFLRFLFLTLKWSRGVSMDPKNSFRTLAQKRKVIGRSPSLTLSNFTLRFFWWQKNLHRPCASSAN